MPSYAHLDIADDDASRITDDESQFESKWVWSTNSTDLKNNFYWAKDFVMHPNGSPVLTEIKNNMKSGITVSLVNVPLSISLAIAGGADPAMGVVTAFWAGIVSAFLGGSQYNIVGPTGALSGVLAAAVLKYNDNPDVLPMLAIFAGMIAFLVWILKLDRYVMFIPSSVIHGFTVGVAFIIALNQLNYILGLSGLEHKESFLGNVWESLLHIGHANPYSVVYFAINLAALFLLLRKWPTIPWAIVIALVGIIVGFMVTQGWIPINLETLQDRFGDLSLSLVHIPAFKGEFFSAYVISQSFGVAFIAILETLISARIADGMTKSEHNQRREVLGISICNMLVGFVGGIPATAALARTSLNVKSGATSRVSAIINCVSVLLISVVFLRFFKYIPMSTIAAMLVMTAIRMVEIHHLKHMYKFDRKMFTLLMVTAAVCIIFDTMMGILVGGLISLLLFTNEMSEGHTEIHVTKNGNIIDKMDVRVIDKAALKKFSPKGLLVPTPNTSASGSEETELTSTPSSPSSPSLDGVVPQYEEFGNTIVYRLTGQLTYINSVAHVQRIKKLAHDGTFKNVIISCRYLFYIDLDGVDALEEMVTKLEHHNKNVFLAGCSVNETVHSRLLQHPFFNKKVDSGAVFLSYVEALKFVAGKNVENQDQIQALES